MAADKGRQSLDGERDSLEEFEETSYEIVVAGGEGGLLAGDDLIADGRVVSAFMEAVRSGIINRTTSQQDAVEIIKGQVGKGVRILEAGEAARAPLQWIRAYLGKTMRQEKKEKKEEALKRLRKLASVIAKEAGALELEDKAILRRMWCEGASADRDAIEHLESEAQRLEQESGETKHIKKIGRVTGLMDPASSRREMSAYKGAKGYDEGEKRHPGYKEASNLLKFWAGRAADSMSTKGVQMVAAEIGAGTGLITEALGRQLASANTTLAAVEIDQIAYNLLDQRIKDSGLNNVVVLRGAGEHVLFAEKGLHLAIEVLTLHHRNILRIFMDLSQRAKEMRIARAQSPLDDTTGKPFEPELYIVEECPSFSPPENPDQVQAFLREMHGAFVGWLMGEKCDLLISQQQDRDAAFNELSAVINDELKSQIEGAYGIDIVTILLKRLGRENYWPGTFEEWVEMEKALEEKGLPSLPISGELKLSVKTLQSVIHAAGFKIRERVRTTEGEIDVPNKGGLIAFRCRLAD